MLLFCLLLTSTGCSLNISLQFGNDQSDAAEGTGAFPEELSEEDRAKWDQAVKDALEEKADSLFELIKNVGRFERKA